MWRSKITHLRHCSLRPRMYTYTYIYLIQSGKTALHFAVDQEHEDIVELLLKANIDPDLQLNVSHMITKQTIAAMSCTSYTIAKCSLVPKTQPPQVWIAFSITHGKVVFRCSVGFRVLTKCIKQNAIRILSGAGWVCLARLG